MKRIRFVLLAALAIGMLIGLPRMSMLHMGSSASEAGSTAAALVRLAEPGESKVFGILAATGFEPNELVSWSLKDPRMILQRTPITGLQPGEKITGSDYDAVDDKIIVTSNLGGLYKVDKTTGTAFKVGQISSAFTNPNIGFDIDPISKLARLINNEAMKNVLVDPSTGRINDFDRDLFYASDDPKAGQKPSLSGIAYKDNRPAQNTSSLFGIDTQQDTLVTLDPATGTVRTVGSLGVNTTDVVGFDISPNGKALASMTDPNNPTSSRLYRINLETGTALEIGSLGGDKPVSGIALDAEVEFADLNCMVVPESKTNPVGTTHAFEVIVKVNGEPVEGAFVSPSITAGPNHPRNFEKSKTEDDPDTAEKDPKAKFSYDSNGVAGTDTIRVVAAFNDELCDCAASKTWVEGQLVGISEVVRDGKNLVVKGCCFKSGDTVLINDILQTTKRDPNNPETVLIAKKGFKKLEACNADFKNRVYVRREEPGKPVQDTSAFATCP